MVTKNFTINLETRRTVGTATPIVVEGDTGNVFKIVLTDEGTPIDLTGCRIVAVFANNAGTFVQDSALGNGGIALGGDDDNEITLNLFSGSYSKGTNTCQIQIYSGESLSTLITTADFTFEARAPLLNDNTITSDNNFPVLVELLNRVEDLAEREQADWTEDDTESGTFIQNKPSEFTPSAHASTHATGEDDEITPADIGAASTSHASTHATGEDDEITPEDIGAMASDAAPNAHASSHAVGEADEITPAAIGALPYNAVPSNLIINGGFDIWQRGTSLAAGAGGFLADRWNDVAVTATIAPSQQTFTVGQTDVTGEPQFYHRAVVVAGNNAASFARTHQRIEDVRKLAGRTVTISFWAKADASKYIAVEFLQSFGSGGSPSAFVSGIGAEKIAVTTSWQKITRTIVMPSIGGKTLGTTPNTSYTQFAIWYDSGADSAARASNIGYQSGTFDIANVQLNHGPVALPFVPRSYADELRLCQRYYEKSYQINAAPGTLSMLVACEETATRTTAASVRGTFFSVRKRVTPTVTIYSPDTGASGKVRGGDGNDYTATASNVGEIGFSRVSITSVATSVSIIYHYTADAEL